MPQSTTPEKLLEEYVDFLDEPQDVKELLKGEIPAFLKKWRSEP